MTLIDQTIPQRSDGLYSSYQFVESLTPDGWATRLQQPEADYDKNQLQAIQEEGERFYSTNCPAPKHTAELEGHAAKVQRPIMMIEFGFGHTTYELLRLCEKINGYLITVEMPVSPEAFSKSENYDVAYNFGVDRYVRKYPYCLHLANHPLGRRRWIWINDDCIAFVDRLASDTGFREKLLLGGKIDYFHEDAIHDDAILASFLEKLSPHMAAGGIFTGDDNTPTRFF